MKKDNIDNQLKPCPFCGSKVNSYKDLEVWFLLNVVYVEVLLRLIMISVMLNPIRQ